MGVSPVKLSFRPSVFSFPSHRICLLNQQLAPSARKQTFSGRLARPQLVCVIKEM